jgi:hypothetical protein
VGPRVAVEVDVGEVRGGEALGQAVGDRQLGE